jgi:hypothetical protein
MRDKIDWTLTCAMLEGSGEERELAEIVIGAVASGCLEWARRVQADLGRAMLEIAA